MKKLTSKKGFTLIEMLVVIAIIAVLVAIVVPTVTSSTTKAQAATDAANLRTVAAEAAVYMLSNDNSLTGFTSDVTSKIADGATLTIAKKTNGDIEAYFVKGDDTYTITSLSAAAENGDIDTAKGGTVPGTAIWTAGT